MAKGRVLLVTFTDSELFFRIGNYVGRGEDKLDKPYDRVVTPIDELWLEPEAEPYDETIEMMKAADVIILCPRSLYGSLFPNFLVNGMKEIFNESGALKCWVSNIMSENGQASFGKGNVLSLSDHLIEIEKYTGTLPDIVIVNTRLPPDNLLEKYRREENAFSIPCDKGRIKKLGVSTIEADLLSERAIEKQLCRHGPEKLGTLIYDELTRRLYTT